MFAIEKENKEAVRVLLNYGADKTAVNHSGKSIDDYLEELGDEEIK